MAILITGGAGYIGSHTCVELLNSGYEIIVVDNYVNSKPESLERVSQITGRKFKVYNVDLLKHDQLNQVFVENEIEAVLHLAGRMESDESADIPLSYYYNDVTGTIILCEIMKKHNVKKLVFSSTAVVYDLSGQTSISEEVSRWTLDAYGKTKILIEEILYDQYFFDPSWNMAILRYFQPAGAHESGFLGENSNRSLIKLLKSILFSSAEKPSIESNQKEPIGSVVRDYIHVVDLAAGHVRALEKVLKSSGIDAYNLGTGRTYSTLEMVQAFETASGIALPYIGEDTGSDDLSGCFVNPSKANKELSWESRRGLVEIFKDSWQWQGKNQSILGMDRRLRKNHLVNKKNLVKA